MRSFRAELVPKPDIGQDLKDFIARGSLDIEIGAGQGFHAIKYCQLNPQRNLLAIERTESRFLQLARRLAAHPGLNNLYVIRADAVSVISHYVPEQSIERVFVLYPNPYPKPKQTNLRWHNMPFIFNLRLKMKPKALIHLATNIESYAIEARREFQACWNLELVQDTILAKNATPRTHFEKKYLARGDRCWNMVFCKD